MNIDRAEAIAEELDMPVVYQYGVYSLAVEVAMERLAELGVCEMEHVEAAIDVLRARIRDYNEEY